MDTVHEVTRVTETSEAILKSAAGLSPGGLRCSGSGWYGRTIPPRSAASPLVITKGKGASVTDADGNQYVDFIGGQGALILGHADDRVVAAITKAASKGYAFSAAVESEVRLSELVVGRHPSIDRFRLTGTPLEALASAVRLARSHTRRRLIVSTEGYTGEGVCRGEAAGRLRRRTTESACYASIPYDDINALAQLLEERGKQLAAIVLEPIGVSTGLRAPTTDYLKSVRTLCDQHGALILFDETITGFRNAAAYADDVAPDLTLLGPIIGGGLPLAGFGGRVEIMEAGLRPTCDTFLTGMGHELAVAAGIATLQALAEPDFYETLEAKADRLDDGLRTASAAECVSICHTRVGNVLSFSFPEQEDDSGTSVGNGGLAQYSRWHTAMLDRGVLLSPQPGSCIFLSAGHTNEDIDHTIAAARDALQNIGN